MWTLHCAPGTIATAVAIALEEVGAPHDIIRVDFAKGEQQSPAYLARNPKGRVPLLEGPGGLLTETGAILEHVAPALVPDDPWQAAKVRELMYYLAGTMHVAHAHKMRGSRWADSAEALAEMTAKVPQTMTACCAYLEESLRLAPFALGGQMTVADPYLTVVLGWAPGDGVDMTRFPMLGAYHARMMARPAAQAVVARGLL